jgi:hypothetical protein
VRASVAPTAGPSSRVSRPASFRLRRFSLIHSCALRRHARHRALQSKPPGGCRSAPRCALSVAPDRRSPVRLLARFDSSLLLATAFRSLVTTARFRAPIPRSTFPACCFRAHARPSPRPSTSRSSAPGGLHPPASVSLQPTRTLVPDRRFQPRLGSPLPFADFTPLRIKAFNPICCRKAHLPNPPDRPSLPAAALIE